ncbi:MAG: hypothetical protein IPM80_08190 [Proteobacteria bacterium]|nr:hypothetical protein [Pseudomonadota bacterium]
MKRRIRQGWLAIVLGLCAAVAQAGDYEDAERALADGRREQALNSFGALAA